MSHFSVDANDLDHTQDLKISTASSWYTLLRLYIYICIYIIIRFIYLFTKGTEQYRIYKMQNNHKCKNFEEKEVLRFAWSDDYLLWHTGDATVTSGKEGYTYIRLFYWNINIAGTHTDTDKLIIVELLPCLDQTVNQWTRGRTLLLYQASTAHAAEGW